MLELNLNPPNDGPDWIYRVHSSWRIFVPLPKYGSIPNKTEVISLLMLGPSAMAERNLYNIWNGPSELTESSFFPKDIAPLPIRLRPEVDLYRGFRSKRIPPNKAPIDQHFLSKCCTKFDILIYISWLRVNSMPRSDGKWSSCSKCNVASEHVESYVLI